ncbi:MAG: hypothetical protein KGY75_07000 [Candidatus Cloacimonetes bacterium]|nr:hypothetical protein [Candidatus Cloacimonadota bacterium]MBS3767849.1 hypothetical protein [Candidatus Cloacimonadota bacterium]
MKQAYRVFATTILGLIFGLVCYALAAAGPQTIQGPIIWQMVLSRTVLGFALGISVFTFYGWFLRGIIVGALFSLPLAFSSMMGAAMSDMSSKQLFLGTIIMGMIYGFLIELITSVILRLKIETCKE